MTLGKMHIAQRPFQVAHQRDTDHCRYSATVDRVTSHDRDMPSEFRAGALGRRQVRPPDFAR